MSSARGLYIHMVYFDTGGLVRGAPEHLPNGPPEHQCKVSAGT